MRRVVMFTGLLACGAALPAAAAVTVVPGTEFETSGWAGAAIFDDSGTRFRACYMLRDYGDVALIFSLDKAGQLSVGLKNDDWTFSDDYETRLRFQLDDWVDTEVAAAAETPQVLLIPAGTGDEIIAAFQQGNGIVVTGDEGRFELPLTGTSRALPALADCVANVPDEPGKAPLTDEERRVVRALALYPPEVREAILDATLHPDIIAGLNEIAAGSRTAFRALVGDLPRESQQLVWEVVRYPAMLDAVVALGASPSEDAVRAAIADQPPEAQESLLQLMAAAPELAGQAHAVRLEAEDKTAALLAKYPLEVESAFRIVLEHPEALAKMAEEPEMVEKIATVYQRDPAFALQRLDEIAQQIDADYDDAVETWAQQLQANPEAANQLVEASRSYAESSGIPPTEPTPTDPTTEEDVDADLSVEAAEEIEPEAPGETAAGPLEPYPYYYGPPPGYDSYYPYQPEDYAGYYLNELGELVVTGLMTYAFMDWMFDDDDDWWDRYPDLSSEVIINVDRDNIWIGGGNDRVRDWVDDNRDDLPDGWFDNDGDLRDRMKDYAGAHRDFDDWREKNPGKGGFQDFVKDSGDRFPNLKEHNDKLLGGKGGGKQQLGDLLAQHGGGGDKVKDALKGQNLLGGVDPQKAKDKLGGGKGLGDKDLAGTLKQGDKKGKVKLQKKDKARKDKAKKKQRQDGWKGGGGKKKKRKG